MSTIDLGLSLVWTKASTGQSVFRPLTPVLDSTAVGGARMACEIRSPSGDVVLLPAFVAFNDPSGSWGTAAILVPGTSPTWWAPSGWQYMEQVRDLRTLLAGSRFVVFGVAVRNATTATRQLATVGGVLDLFGWSP